ncbi:hypothetical protein HIM_09192 [Hirsutella minnesotensis 3608]|uniref:Uncharacterized protein n=1 Tax=Hirsutella minnesotensis 3608 TaxID=1043627 RepID=A0A0F8A388_9HYPO|nr:hypothetical protein HIM_09192 [Hirsutella minnesotensis 3608]
MLNADGSTLPGAMEALSAENNVKIAGIAWLTNKESGEAYGSMVIYVTKRSDAQKLLEGLYFDLAVEDLGDHEAFALREFA